MAQFIRRQLLAALAALPSLAALFPPSWAGTSGDGPVVDNKPGERIEPLFLSQDDARSVMRQYCQGDADMPMTEKHIELLASRLRPQIWIARRNDGGGGPGETRLGGAPDLPPGMAWPMRPVPQDVEEKTKQWTAHHAWIVKQMQHALPFEFIGQIDLAEVAQFPTHAEGLPATGQLLFFWDGALGFLESGSTICRVIHDETPSAQLSRAPVPELFSQMEAWWREPDPKTTAHFKEMARNLEAAGQKAAATAMRNLAKKSEAPDPASTKPFVYPPRAMRLVPLWVLPRQNAVELTQDPELTAFENGDETSAHYSLLTSNDTGPFTSDNSNMTRTQEWLTLEARRTRLMGPPGPEQDDPRFNAVGTSNLPAYPWTAAQVAEASGKAREWQLLLQVSMADLAQLQTEGTIYFMIHKDDLAKRDFTRVVASFQQT